MKRLGYARVVICIWLLCTIGCDDSERPADFIELDIARRIVERDQESGQERYRDGLVLSLSSMAELERTIGHLDAARSLIEKALEQFDWLRNKVPQGDLRASYSAGFAGFE